MKYRPIGRSGLISSCLTLGTMLFGENSKRTTSETEAEQLIDRFLEAGGNHIDCADVYAEGRSEEITGRILKDRRHELVLSSKVRFPTSNNVNDQGLSRRNILGSTENILRRLQTDHLDLLYLHCRDSITPLEETLRAVEDLIRSGKIRYWGFSNFPAWEAMKMVGLCDRFHLNRCIAAQYQYSLVQRDLENEFLELFQSEGIGLLPWGPLGGGFLTGKYKRETSEGGRIEHTPDHAEEAWHRRNTERNWQTLDLVRELADTHDTTPIAISLAWLLHRPTVASVVIGPRIVMQLADNLAATEIRLSEKEMQRLDKISRPESRYPYRMIAAYAKREF